MLEEEEGVGQQASCLVAKMEEEGGEDRLPALFCSYGNHSREDKCRNFQTIVELQ